jgi:hypothetical protein
MSKFDEPGRPWNQRPAARPDPEVVAARQAARSELRAAAGKKGSGCAVVLFVILGTGSLIATAGVEHLM